MKVSIITLPISVAIILLSFPGQSDAAPRRASNSAVANSKVITRLVCIRENRQLTCSRSTVVPDNGYTATQVPTKLFCTHPDFCVPFAKASKALLNQEYSNIPKSRTVPTVYGLG